MQLPSVRGAVVGGPIFVEGAVRAVRIAAAFFFHVLYFAAARPAEDDVMAHCGLWIGYCLDALWLRFRCWMSSV